MLLVFKKYRGSFLEVFSIICVCTILQSCISNKKITYLQGTEAEKDTVTYNQVSKKYETKDKPEDIIKPYDQLLINVRTLTPLEYNPYAIIEVENRVQSTNTKPEQGSLRGFDVDATGGVHLPLLGEVHLAGMSFMEAEMFLQEKLAQYMDTPSVTIKLLNFRFSILGEVRREGMYGTYSRRLSVLEGIAMAGGETDYGDRKKVKLLRKNGETTDIVYLDLSDENFVESPYYYLRQEDVIIIQPVKNRATVEYVQKNVSIFVSVASIIISVITLISTN